MTEEIISDVSVLFDMIEIRNRLKTCDIFSRGGINEVTAVLALLLQHSQSKI